MFLKKQKYKYTQKQQKIIIQIVMSQPSSSVMSVDHPELKYKKALKQINKLITANRQLHQNSEKAGQQFKEKIDQLALRYDHLEKEYEMVRKQKQSLSEFIEELQETNNELNKERKNLERQLGYLNDVLAEQNAQLKKIHTHKDQRALAALIRTYEEKENVMDRNRVQQDDMIIKLKDNLERLENNIVGEKTIREELEDKYNRLLLQINKYKELNSTLMQQNQRILNEHNDKENFTIQKEKELQLLANQFKRQIETLKNTSNKAQFEQQMRNGGSQNYQYILSQKNQLELQLNKVKDLLIESQEKERQFYEIQQKYKSALNRAERAVQEVNMLKNKIVVLEAKQFLEEAGEDDYNQKQFEDRLNLMIAQNDPLHAIKNGDDNSHFRLLKSFIFDLQDKIYRINNEKKDASKKYRSIKNKFVKNAEQLGVLEDQNKLLKGKVEGYERLTEKLQYELEKSLSTNEEEITKITITSNNLITKKSEQYKATISLLNSQLQMQNDKASRTEKNLKQQIETLKLELGSLKIKFKDLSDKSTEEGGFMELYKRKNDELVQKINKLEEQLSEINETLTKYENLLKEEKGKNQGLIIQKQQLNSQVKQLCDQLDRKSYQLGQTTKVKEDNYEFELKRITSENKKIKEQLEYSQRELIALQREVEDRRGKDKNQIQQISRLTSRNRDVEEMVISLKRKIREVEDENENLKIRASKFQSTFQKSNTLQEEIMNKNDLVNDLKRQILILQNDLKSIESQLADQKKQSQMIKKDFSTFKIKSLENGHDIKKDYETKSLENKRTIQNLNQEISELLAEIREEKTKNSRMVSELNTAKSQKNRLQQIIQQNRRKEYQVQGQTGNLKIEISNLNMENQKSKNEIKTHQLNINNLNQEIESLQQKIFSLNQEVSGLKMKLETAEDSKSDLVRDLTSLRSHIAEVENYSIKLKTGMNPTWEEQCFTSSLSEVIHKLRKFCRYYDITIQNKGSGSITQSVGRKSDLNVSGSGLNLQALNMKSIGKDQSKIQEFNSSSFSKTPPLKSNVRVLSSERSSSSSYRVGNQPAESYGNVSRNFVSSESIGSEPIDYTYSNSSKVNSYSMQGSGLGGSSVPMVGRSYQQSTENWMNPSYGLSENNYFGNEESTIP